MPFFKFSRAEKHAKTAKVDADAYHEYVTTLRKINAPEKLIKIAEDVAESSSASQRVSPGSVKAAV